MIVDKTPNRIRAKTLDLELRDIDPSTRTVVGYFSAFDSIDADRDIIRKGAFAKSIAERGPYSAGNRKIAHLWNHDWAEPIGQIKELMEDDYGLRFVSQMGRSAKGQDVFLNYQDGILREHSIGFYYLEGGIEAKEDSKLGLYYDITEVELFEGSTVTFGANSLAKLVSVTKSEEKALALDTLNKEMDRYFHILRHGQGTDERFYEIEMGLKTLQSKYFELLNLKPVEKEVQKEAIIEKKEAPVQKKSALKSFIFSVLNK